MSETPKVSQVSRTSFTIATWTGDLDDFDEVIRTVEGLVSVAVREGESSLGSRTQQEKADFLKDFTFLRTEKERDEVWNEHSARERRDFHQAMEIRMKATVGRFDQENDGPPGEVLRSIDFSDLKSVSLVSGNASSGYGSQGFGLEITFDREKGCSVRAVAPSNHLVSLVKSQLREVLVKGRPWYWWLRAFRYSTWVFFLPVMLTVLQIAFLVPGLVLPTAGQEPPSLTRSAIVGIFVGLLALPPLYGVVALVRKLLPAFELTKVGKSTRGARSITLVVSLAAWVTSVIVIPLFMR